MTEDAGKTGDGGVSFFATLNDVGLKVNRVSINWDAANPTTIGAQAEIASLAAAGPGRRHADHLRGRAAEGARPDRDARTPRRSSPPS